VGVTVVVVILAGGLGTRIRALYPDRPKPLIPVCGRPFLERQVEGLVEQGLSEIVLCVSHLAEQITSHFGAGAAFGARIRYSIEPTPLGTGGALRHAAPLLDGTALVLNGDTFLDADYLALAALHRERVGEGAWACVCLATVAETSAFGRARLDAGGRIVGFDEKSSAAGGGQVNAGACFLEPSAIAGIPEGRVVSLEREVFPALAARGRLFGLPSGGRFLDMGTPEGHRRLTRLLDVELEGGEQR
jgi:NDP-sugar pyrophosphorylase family protein